MSAITIETLTGEQIDQCRDLCNELMAFQKSKAVLAPDAFDGMSFDTRMKKSYENALASQVIVAKDDGTPIGYVFSTIEATAGMKGAVPAWAPVKPGEKVLGFLPEWEQLPEKVGILSNLYIRDAYRGSGLGSRLCDLSMDWLESFPDVDLSLVFISNGNNAALDFYLRHGFTYSHEVFGGFIKAAYKRKS